MTDRIDDYQSFALSLARIAEGEIMPRFRSCAVSIKPDGTEVTDADRAAEKAVRAAIATTYPTHGILGEEFGREGPSDASELWIIDPLDGTASFTLGVPTFGVLIALAIDGEARVGVIHFPAIGETVYAAAGRGCWFQASGERAMRVRADHVSSLRDATISSTGTTCSDLQPMAGRPAWRLSNVIPAVRKFRFVSDCLQHALVCRGRLHAAIDTLMSPWDTAALLPCLSEAGAIASDMHGRNENLIYAGSLISSCSAELHAELVGTMSPRD